MASKTVTILLEEEDNNCKILNNLYLYMLKQQIL